MNNRNLEYDEGYWPPHAEMVAAALRGLDERRGVAGFLKAIMDATPNGESIVVSYHPNGDWFVAKEPYKPLEIAARERFARSIKPGRNGKRSKSSLEMIARILQGEWDDSPGYRSALAEEFLARQKPQV